MRAPPMFVVMGPWDEIPWLERQKSAPRTASRNGCVRDARPQGRDVAAGQFPPARPGAVGHSGIVPYRARSPARSAAEGHALWQKCVSALVREGVVVREGVSA